MTMLHSSSIISYLFLTLALFIATPAFAESSTPSDGSAAPKANTLELDVHDLCPLIMQPPEGQKAETTCRYTAEAIRLMGPNACHQNAKNKYQKLGCINSTEVANPILITELDSKSICELIMNPRTERDLQHTCYYVDYLYSLSEKTTCDANIRLLSEKVCLGKLNHDIEVLEHNPALATKKHMQSLCIGLARAKQEDNHDELCQFSAEAIELGGDGACAGRAYDLYMENGCLNAINRNLLVPQKNKETKPSTPTSKQKQPLSREANHAVDRGLTVSELCTRIVEAKSSNLAPLVCRNARLALEIGGERACLFNLKDTIEEYCE